jgi:hypothetical protein
MPVQRRGKIIKLIGNIGVEDAEIVYAQYEQQLFQKVDLQQCEHLHSAVLQLLLQFQLPIHRLPQQQGLADWISCSVSLYQVSQEAPHG